MEMLDYGPEILEAKIARLESGMGIEAPADRFLEACLLVDQRFIVASLLTESDLPIERMFGDKEWAGYLQARLLTRHADEQYQLHDAFAIGWLLEDIDTCLMTDEGQVKGGEMRGPKYSRGGRFVDGEFCPVDLTPAQVSALDHLPWVSFLSAGDPEHPHRGYIKYVEWEVEHARDEIFHTFGSLSPELDAYEEAAGFQQAQIQIHPFAGGVNGRGSRAVMNWRLERRGCYPSIPASFAKDVFSTPEEWVGHVKNGSELYGMIRQRIDDGIEDPIDLLGLRGMKTFHDRCYMPSPGIVVPIFEPNAHHSHTDVERYLADLEQALQRRNYQKKLGEYAYHLSDL